MLDWRPEPRRGCADPRRARRDGALDVTAATAGSRDGQDPGRGEAIGSAAERGHSGVNRARRPHRARGRWTVGPALLAAALVLGACVAVNRARPAAAAVEINRALEGYRALIVRQDAPAIAALYTEQGSMAHRGSPAVVGRAAIQRFLESYAAYRVLAEELVADSTEVSGARGTQLGHYRQSVETPHDGTVTVSGTFRAEWLRGRDGRWRIERFETAPPP